MSIEDTHFRYVISSDASRSSWGACCGNKRASGHGKVEEKEFHINFLELLAALFTLKCLAVQVRDCNVLLRVDNTTAISYMNRKGGFGLAT